MKFVINQLQFGDVIEAEVTEILSDEDIIMSFRGDLLRVQNHSQINLKLGQKLNCRVRSVQPLRFEIAGECKPSFKMDLVV